MKTKRALISVYFKEGLEPIVRELHKLGIELISTGGTLKYIKDLDIPVKPVEEFTGYPSILGGRVKTLHPSVFGGILTRRDIIEDAEDCNKYDINPIDLVIVDLYPFEETLESTDNSAEIIEKIDIGGISLIRAAAKNFDDVAVISSRKQYDWLLEKLNKTKGEFSLPDRKYLAAFAFHVSSHYDSVIFNWFNKDAGIDVFKSSYLEGKQLRYGENPHQKGTFYGELEEVLEQLHGKEISYNNLLDIDAAIALISEFNETSIAILKHNNACGLASGENLKQLWIDALAGDPVSAFGGVIISNRKIDVETAEEINKIFFEIIIAPEFGDGVLDILRAKKNRIILKLKEGVLTDTICRSLLNGLLVQNRDDITDNQKNFEYVTLAKPDKREAEDLVFAAKIVKHTKSNAIVLVKDKKLVGSGTGQTSRVDALKQAIDKAKAFKLPLENAVLASDAFFPFADNVEIAFNAGIRAVIQPGGSIRDKDSIEFCNENKMSMVFTGTRHFKH